VRGLRARRTCANVPFLFTESQALLTDSAGAARLVKDEIAESAGSLSEPGRLIRLESEPPVTSEFCVRPRAPTGKASCATAADSFIFDPQPQLYKPADGFPIGDRIALSPAGVSLTAAFHLGSQSNRDEVAGSESFRPETGRRSTILQSARLRCCKTVRCLMLGTSAEFLPVISSLSSRQYRYAAEKVKPERLQRAIEADIEWLEAHPTRKSIAASRPRGKTSD
jgi:hypothetical protein